MGAGNTTPFNDSCRATVRGFAGSWPVNYENAVADWVVRHRWAMLLLPPLLVALLAGGVVNYHFTTTYRVFFDQADPQLQALDRIEAAYSQDDNVLLVLAPEQGDALSRRTLAAAEWLTEQAWQIPYSIRVDSVTNFQHTRAMGDDLDVRNLVEGADGMPDAELAEVRRIALSEPALLNRLLPPSADVLAVNVTVQMPRVDETKEVPQVMNHVQGLLEEFHRNYPDIAVKISGMVAMNHAFSQASLDDMSLLVPASFGLMFAILWFSVGSLSGLGAVLLVICMSIAVGLGVGGYVGFPLTPASVSSPTVILTVAIAASVHLLMTFYHQLQKTGSREQAVKESVRVNLQPVFITSLTTAIGFLSLNLSDVPPFRHLGNIVAFGVVASFFLAFTFLPALMLFLPGKASRQVDIGQRWMTALGRWVVKRRRRLLWGTGLIVVVVVSFVPRNELNDVFAHYFDRTMTFRQDADFIDRYLSGSYRVDFSLQGEGANAISDPGYLRLVEDFTQWLRQQPEVVHVSAITDTFKRLNKNMHGDDPAWYRLPEERELAAQYLLLYEMFLPYGLDLNNQVNVDKSASRLVISMPIVSTKTVLGLERRARQWLQDNAPQLATQGASPTLMFAHIGARNTESMLVGTSLALVFISLILVLALRSLKIGLLSMVPNLIPAALGFGLWGLMVGEVGLSLSVVTGMTLGIVVDDTIHFLSKYLRARRELGATSEEAVVYAFSQVGSALLVTTIVLAAGFALLALSHFYLNAGMGLLTAMILGLALLADFLFLPPLLMKIEGRGGSKGLA